MNEDDKAMLSMVLLAILVYKHPPRQETGMDWLADLATRGADALQRNLEEEKRSRR